MGDARPRRGAGQAVRPRATSRTTGDRFRFRTLQSRFAAFIDLWDRGLRAREEGRPGPFAPRAPRSSRGAEKKAARIASCTSSRSRDPVREIDKLTTLYESLAEARREVGEDAVPFHKFAELVKSQVKKLRRPGAPRSRFVWR